MFAGHLPTMHFDHQHWLSMPVWELGTGQFAGPGFKRTRDCRGKPVVFCIPGHSADFPSYAVRPIVRVKMAK